MKSYSLTLNIILKTKNLRPIGTQLSYFRPFLAISHLKQAEMVFWLFIVEKYRVQIRGQRLLFVAYAVLKRFVILNFLKGSCKKELPLTITGTRLTELQKDPTATKGEVVKWSKFFNQK